jgi:hypothetical protein
VLYGFKAGYDYLKPNSFYGGFSGSYSNGKAHGKVTFENNLSYHSLQEDSFDVSLGNIEGRIGYNFQGDRNFSITPFVGVGVNYVGEHLSSSNFPYLALGSRLNLFSISTFDLGLNLKGTYSINEGGFYYDGESFSRAFGCEIGTPLTFHVGKAKEKVDIQIQPYFLRLDSIAPLTNIYGLRVAAGVRF